MSVFKKEGLSQPLMGFYHWTYTLRLQNRMQMFNNFSKVADGSCDINGSTKVEERLEIKNSLTNVDSRDTAKRERTTKVMLEDIILNHHKK